MEWQNIILTPLFWIVSTIGAIILSIIANLITPFASAFLTRRLSARRSGLREKQIKRRDQVITLQANVHRRASVKLDAIFKLLLAIILLLLGIFIFQFSIAQTISPLTSEVGKLLVILLVLLIGMLIGKLGLDDMSLALTADQRERDGEHFRAQHGSASPDEVKEFEDGWDLQAFGVNSKSTPSEAHAQR
jgi:hypothetical protein